MVGLWISSNPDLTCLENSRCDVHFHQLETPETNNPVALTVNGRGHVFPGSFSFRNCMPTQGVKTNPKYTDTIFHAKSLANFFAEEQKSNPCRHVLTPKQNSSIQKCTLQGTIAYPTLRGKGKSSTQKCRLALDMLIPTRRGPLTTISGFIPRYTQLQPWLNRVLLGL